MLKILMLPRPNWLAVLATALPMAAQTQFAFQEYQRPEKCLPCHQRQYDELHSSVKSGYRNVSPLFNGLEASANFLNGGLLRPVYTNAPDVGGQTQSDGKTPLTTNMFTTPGFTDINQVRAGFCFTCHDAHVLRLGENPQFREVPDIATGAKFLPNELRPLRDYHLVDAFGNQILPSPIGAQPPAGSLPSLGVEGISCDVCHNVTGPDLLRSFQGDGFANTSLEIASSVEKIGPFSQAVEVKGDFHIASTDPNKIAFLVSGAFCNACHDVRVPLAAPGDLQHFENDVHSEPEGSKVTYFRLENLSTEWQLGAYNSTNNPFGKVIRCQDCHMSKFPFSNTSTYQVGDMTVTTPTPAVFFTNYAAVPGLSTEGNFPLQQRTVVSHNFTGVDVPLLSTSELSARLGSGYPDPYDSSLDEYGIPHGLALRRDTLLRAAVRIGLDKTDQQAKLGQDFNVRVEAVSLTGHRFPAGFSQERTTWIQLSVKDANGFVLYQSGYRVDKPHPDTGEKAPDGNIDDEDLEHIQAVVDPGVVQSPYTTGAGPMKNGHTNQVFNLGPDDGPDSRVYAGVAEGLVLFRNELTHVFMPPAPGKTAGDPLGRTDASGKQITATKPHYEETFSAALANTVDNFRSLQPLTPRTFRYQITLPTADELQAMGVTLKGPLQVHAQVNYEHFPPLFMRFLARTTGAYGEGPPGHDMGLLNESVIDTYLKTVSGIATADFTIQLEQ